MVMTQLPRSTISVKHLQQHTSSSETAEEPRLLRRLGVEPKSDSYWMHELSYSSLESSDSGYTQQPWLPDDVSGHCMICAQKFTLFRWTHHCRDCGGYVNTHLC